MTDARKELGGNQLQPQSKRNAENKEMEVPAVSPLFPLFLHPPIENLFGQNCQSS